VALFPPAQVELYQGARRLLQWEGVNKVQLPPGRYRLVLTSTASGKTTVKEVNVTGGTLVNVRTYD
jgi:hypothetical protein